MPVEVKGRREDSGQLYKQKETLQVELIDRITELAPETAEWVARQPELSDIAASRQITLQIKTKGDDGGESTTTI